MEDQLKLSHALAKLYFSQNLQEIMGDYLYDKMIEIFNNQQFSGKVIDKFNIVAKEVKEQNHNKKYVNADILTQYEIDENKILMWYLYRQTRSQKFILQKLEQIFQKSVGELSVGEQSVGEVLSLFIKRLTFQTNIAHLILYNKIRNESKKVISGNEKSFIMKLFYIKQDNYEYISKLLKDKRIIANLLEINEFQITHLSRLQNDLHNNVLHNKHKNWQYISNHYQAIQEKTLDYYLNMFSKFTKQISLKNRVLEKSIKQYICACCGSRAQLIDLHKEDKWAVIEQITGKTRAQTNFPEFADEVLSKIKDDVNTFKICYFCSKNELTFAIPERDIPVPDEIKNIKKKALEANIRLGYIYSFIQNIANSNYTMMTGDTHFRLFNGDVGMHKLALDQTWMQHISSKDKAKIDLAIQKLKEINHLYKKFLCTYEVWQAVATNQRLKDLLENESFKTRITRGYQQSEVYIETNNKNDSADKEIYLVPSSTQDHQRELFNIGDLHRLAAFEEYLRDIGSNEVKIDDILKDVEDKFKDEEQQRKEEKEEKIQQEDDQGVNELRRNRVYYSDKYLEEKLFPTLFPTGTGGFNSSYKNEMTITEYAKMKLLSCRSEFRNHYDYIFWLFDRKRKEQMISYSRGVKSVHPDQHEKPLGKLIIGLIGYQTNMWVVQLTIQQKVKNQKQCYQKDYENMVFHFHNYLQHQHIMNLMNSYKDQKTKIKKIEDIGIVPQHQWQTFIQKVDCVCR
ncbi:hypothetical protein OXYTRIMIC_730 [Oxytricha trifallax]|uniref:Uncharacterized protein n=1 Tax=Oxytricha trifallax TaxID=1172189 RepID=A0A073HYU7_9SPIT|nr:hypothetical protein OXYTRIMIC_730 [Oxytricha trifallax]